MVMKALRSQRKEAYYGDDYDLNVEVQTTALHLELSLEGKESSDKLVAAEAPSSRRDADADAFRFRMLREIVKKTWGFFQKMLKKTGLGA
jgi:hypothetical protein